MKKNIHKVIVLIALIFSLDVHAVCFVTNKDSSDTATNALRTFLREIDISEANTANCEISPPAGYDFAFDEGYEFNVAFFGRDLCDAYRLNGINHPCWDADAQTPGIQAPATSVKGIPVDSTKKLATITLSNQLRIADTVQTLVGYYEEHDNFAIPYLKARNLVVKAGDGSVTPLFNCEGRDVIWVGMMNIVVSVGDGVSRGEALGACVVEERDVYVCPGDVLKNPEIIRGVEGENAYLTNNFKQWCKADMDGDGSTNDVDCDDSNPQVNPDATEIIGNNFDENCNPADDGDTLTGSPEVCDGLDNDLDGLTDEDFDADADGYPTCGAPGITLDCDDANSAVNPGKPEICSTTATTDEEDVDDNCDGVKLGKCAPEVVPDPDPSETPDEEICTDIIDNNGDGKIDCDDDECKDRPVCDPDNIDNDGDGLSENAGDCDDTDIMITVCNGEMNVDDDGDGFTEQGGDCDDTDPDVSPGADEICDANPDAVVDDDDCDRQDDDDANADVPLCFDANKDLIQVGGGSGGSSGCGCDMGASANGSGATAVVALLAFGMMIWIRRGFRQA